MAKTHMAINDKGVPTPCSLPIGEEGKGRCNHIAHQRKDETQEEFIKRTSMYSWENIEQYTTRMKDLSKPFPSNFNNEALNREYNRKAYFETKELLDEYGKCCLVQGTSSGKSSVFCRICEDMPDKSKILILTPSAEQVSQLKDTYNVNGMVTTYSDFCDVTQAELSQYDMVILDECHHVGKESNKCAQQLQTMVDFNKNLKMLGATATPLRTDKDNPVNTIFEGHSSSNISTEEIFEKKFLRKPKVVQVDDTDFYKEKFLKMVEDKKSPINKFLSAGKIAQKLVSELNNTNSEQLIEDELSNKIKTNIENNEPSKLIIFCKDAKDGMDQMKEKFDPIIRKACERNHIEMNSEKLVNTQTQKLTTNTRKRLTKEFINNNKKLQVFYVHNMLGEGVHIEGVNMIINNRKTTSATAMSQGMGRELNGYDKQKSDPLYIDMTGQLDEKIDYSNCLTNRKTLENYGKIDKYYRELVNFNKFTTQYKGKQRTTSELIDMWSEELNYKFTDNNKKSIKTWIEKDNLTLQEIKERRWHLIEADALDK